MRVLHFFKTYWPDTFGGIERTIHALAEGSSEHGIKSSVLSLSKVPKDREFGNHMAYKAKLDFEFASTGFSRDVFRRFRDLSAAADIVHHRAIGEVGLMGGNHRLRHRPRRAQYPSDSGAHQDDERHKPQ